MTTASAVLAAVLNSGRAGDRFCAVEIRGVHHRSPVSPSSRFPVGASPVEPRHIHPPATIRESRSELCSACGPARRAAFSATFTHLGATRKPSQVFGSLYTQPVAVARFRLHLSSSYEHLHAAQTRANFGLSVPSIHELFFNPRA